MRKINSPETKRHRDRHRESTKRDIAEKAQRQTQKETETDTEKETQREKVANTKRGSFRFLKLFEVVDDRDILNTMNFFPYLSLPDSCKYLFLSEHRICNADPGQFGMEMQE